MAWQQQSMGGPAVGVETIVWRSSTSPVGPLVIVCFDEASFYQEPARNRDLKVLAESGLVVVAADAPSFGNAEALQAIDDTIVWAGADLGADIDRVSFVGDSRGATTALNWAWRNPSQLGAAVLRIPAVNLAAIHARDMPPGVAAEIDAAWPGGFAGADPSEPANITAIAPIADRCRVWLSTDDPFIPPAEVDTWADATGVQTRSLGATGHDPWTSGAIPHISQALWVWAQQTGDL